MFGHSRPSLKTLLTHKPYVLKQPRAEHSGSVAAGASCRRSYGPERAQVRTDTAPPLTPQRATGSMSLPQPLEEISQRQAILSGRRHRFARPHRLPGSWQIPEQKSLKVACQATFGRGSVASFSLCGLRLFVIKRIYRRLCFCAARAILLGSASFSLL